MLALRGGGQFTQLCEQHYESHLNAAKVLLTPSCTAALELSAILLNLEPGDEVIMPSYTFVSTANAFVLRGARPVFIDIRSDTLNIDEQLIEAAITEKTRAIVPVHYGGVVAEMTKILQVAESNDLVVIEDAAHALGATYYEEPAGSFGCLSTLSFHETKNVTSGEGGALIFNYEGLVQNAQVIREKGTNRKDFLEGAVNKYTWVDIGSSYLPSEFGRRVSATSATCIPRHKPCSSKGMVSVSRETPASRKQRPLEAPGHSRTLLT